MDEYMDVKPLISMISSNSRPKPQLYTYDGSVVAENLMDWISELHKYCEYEEIQDYIVVTTFKAMLHYAGQCAC